jgi:hypothetical protein
MWRMRRREMEEEEKGSQKIRTYEQVLHCIVK